MLSLHYHELLWEIREHEGKKRKKYMMVEDYMVGRVLNKIKKIIDIEKFDDTKILIETDDKLSDDINLKKFVISMTCVIKDCNAFYLQPLLEHALYVN